MIRAWVPYGHWPSPITAAQVAAASTTFDELRFAGDRLLWLEGRPDEAGRTVLVADDQPRGRHDIVPAGVDVGSSVYGYGGGAYAANDSAVWYCDAADGQIWTATGSGGAPTRLTADAGARYADLHAGPAGLLCVREHEADRASDIVLLGQAGPRSLVSGQSLCAHPRLAPDQRRLAWVSWPETRMPWDSTQLWLTDIQTPHNAPVLIAGGDNESVLQPSWGPDSELYFLSDRSGWWNLYRHRHGAIEPVLTGETEMGAAPWEAGYTTYAFLPGHRIAVQLQNGPAHRLVLHHLRSGTTEAVPLPYTSLKPYLASHSNRLAFIGSSPTKPATVAVLDLTTGALRELAGGASGIPTGYLPEPDTVSIPTRDGTAIHGLLHPPTNPEVQPPPGTLPPLIVRIHPGPTANVSLRLDPTITYFTSRGFMLLDLDYHGSTGYGRAYRDALNHHWGILDVTDTIDAAHHLITTSRADPHAIFITGASAGGYTALRALAHTDLFAAGTARSAIADPASWRTAVPRLQRHHTDQLIGPSPESSTDHRDRSVLHDGEHLNAPVLLLHGQRDTIAPAEPITELAAQLVAAGHRGTLILFPEEGHSLRGARSITRALTAELALYRETLDSGAGPTPSLD
jgi:dipeptidyl aminopeptidase/acylaminoacyl peptidase